jgi:TetR/AcrR family transcriptional regulator, mexJK operon transcriptional repressor
MNRHFVSFDGSALALYQTKLYSLIMTVGKQVLSARARSKQAQIRDGARRAFLANGFAATTTDAIATEAGVSKQTLYVYYRAKEGLFLDVLREIVGQLPDVASTIAAGAQLDSPAALRACLTSLARELLAHLMQPDYVAFMRLVFAEIPRMPQLGELWQRTIPAQVVGVTANVLETARARGIAHFADTNAAVRLFIGPLITFVVLEGLATAEPPRPPDDSAIRQIVDLFLAAIAHPDAA